MKLVCIDSYLFNYACELGELFKLDKLTREQESEIKSQAPFIEFLTSQCEYAPEIKKRCLWIPLWALRNTNVYDWLFLGEREWAWDYESMKQAVLFS